MSKNYLNAKNTPIIASIYAHGFSSNHAAKFALEEWFLSEPLTRKNSFTTYPFIKHYIYEEIEVILKMNMCTSPESIVKLRPIADN